MRARDLAGNQLAYAIASRQFRGVVVHAFTLRSIALVAVITVLLQRESAAALLACLPAVGICLLRAGMSSTGAQGEVAQGEVTQGEVTQTEITQTEITQREITQTEITQTEAAQLSADRARAPRPAAVPARSWLWGVIGLLDILTALAVVAVAACATAPLPTTSRFLALGFGMLLVTVVVARLCLDPRWYRPRGTGFRGGAGATGNAARTHGRVGWPGATLTLRLLAGPLGTIACLAIALPAPWGPGETAIVVLCASIPLATMALVVDQDLTLGCAVDMVHTEAQGGRQSVLDELHGTLAANLRLLEQASQDLRATSPRLYELAVAANSRLRETLTLADPLSETAARPETLAALVRTLTMAVGARGSLTVDLVRLSDSDRDLVRLVLNDLVRALLAGGATHADATLVAHGGQLMVSVAGDVVLGEDASLALAPLRRRLATAQGSVAVRQRSLIARWPGSPATR